MRVYLRYLAGCLTIASFCRACTTFSAAESVDGGGGGDAAGGDAGGGEASSGGNGEAGDADPGLLAYYRFDEGGGTTLGNSLGTGHNGTISNGTWVPGREGGALHFGGTNTCVDLKSWGTELDGAFTVSVWALVDDFDVDGESRYVVSRTTSSDSNGWRLATEASDSFTMKIAVADAAPVRILGQSSPGSWVHVAAVYEPGAQLKLYIAGDLRGVGTGVPSSIPPPPNDTLNLGCSNGKASYFSGKLDEVRIYGRALEEREVKALAQ